MKKKGIIAALITLIAAITIAIVVLLVLMGKDKKPSQTGDPGKTQAAASQPAASEPETKTSAAGPEKGTETEAETEKETKPEETQAAAASAGGLFEDGKSGTLGGNMTNGGFVTENAEQIFYSYHDALWSMRQDGSDKKKLYDGNCENLAIWGDRIYFVQRTEVSTDDGYYYYIATPFSMKTDGSDLKQLGATRNDHQRITEYKDFGDGRDLGYVRLAYSCFTVYNGAIYYISSNDRSGSYYSDCSWGDSKVLEYDSNNSIYRMNLDGTGVKELVQDVGTANPVFSIANGVIYFTTCYMNPYFSPYDFVSYYYAPLDGSGNSAQVLEVPANALEGTFSGDKGSYVEYVLGIQADQSRVYTSCGDSEGEFPNSRFHVYLNSQTGFGDALLSECGWTHTIAADGVLYVSAGENYYGVDPYETTNKRIEVCDQNGNQRYVLKVFDTPTYGKYADFDLNVTKDWVYYRTSLDYNQEGQEELGRISKDGSRQEILELN